MKRIKLLSLFSLVLLINIKALGSSGDLSSVKRQIQDSNWSVEEVGKDVTLRQFHFNSLFGAKQYITVLDINIDGNVVIDIPFVTEGFVKTSEFGENENAIVAVNGSFFDTKVGGSTVFLRSKGELITKTREKFNTFRENAGFAIDSKSRIAIVNKQESDVEEWEDVKAETLLTSGPRLITDGVILIQENNPFNNNRHPRTAVGLTKDNHLIMVVVDGRSSESYGMTTGELAEVMYSLGCVDAMNLDGGGSSTAWIKGKGVVNHPSDNKLFDNNGERGVANAIIVKNR
ncbi:MAG: phosphodiester glycosidase family protein [Fermentimonas sp.]|jgi:exopolysaccharide biosynthesis protein